MIELVSEDRGPLWVYELPDPDEDYVIGADTAEGKIRSRDADFLDSSNKDPDYNGASVQRMSDGKEVARYMSNYSPSLYSADLVLLGKYYGTASGCKEDALIVPERNAIGMAVVDDLIDAEYPRLFIQRRFNKLDGVWEKNIGFRTGPDNRDILIKDLQRVVLDGSCGITDRITAKHVASMRRNKMGKAEAPSGAHDDLAMAFMLGMMGRREVRIESGVEEAERPPKRSQSERDAEFAAKVFESGMDDDVEDIDPANEHLF